MIPEEFPLVETPRERSAQAPDVPRSLRTEWNARDSDGTLVLRPADLPLDAGTAWTLHAAGLHGRPLLEVDPVNAVCVRIVKDWIADHDIHVLNIAGPSERQAPGIGDLAESFTKNLLS